MGRVASRIYLRSGTTSEWTQKNPFLQEGEFTVEYSTDGSPEKFKIGPGYWLDLPYVPMGGANDDAQALLDHINSDTPHPVYDDGPSLLLLYENAKV